MSTHVRSTMKQDIARILKPPNDRPPDKSV